MSVKPGHTFKRLLITQVALTLVYPLLGESWGISFLLGAFFVLALYGGVSATQQHPVVMWISIFLGVMFVAGYWMGEALDLRRAAVWSLVWGTAFFWWVAGAGPHSLDDDTG